MSTGHLDAAAVREAVTLWDLFRIFKVKTHGPNRADCFLCEGGRSATLAVHGGLYHCHRCGAGGDVFTFVEHMRGCSFPEALAFLADVAGIRPETGISREEIARRQRQRAELDQVTSRYEAMERAERLSLAEQSRSLARTARLTSDRLIEIYEGSPERFPREAACWERTLSELPDQERRVLAAYNLLAFGPVETRVGFVLHPERREQLTTDALLDGITTTKDIPEAA